MYTVGKPGKAGGPLQGCTYTRKPVYAGGLVVCIREARQGGRPGDKCNIVYMEAGLCRRPYCKHLGSPTLRDAHYKDLHTYGSWSMPEALLCVKGKPDKAGNLTQPLTQCKNQSPRIRPPLTPIPILTRPSPNLPQSPTLPSHLHCSPLTPAPNTCQHLLTPSVSKTTTSTIRDGTLMATVTQSNQWQRQTKLVLNCCDHDTDPLLDPPKG